MALTGNLGGMRPLDERPAWILEGWVEGPVDEAALGRQSGEELPILHALHTRPQGTECSLPRRLATGVRMNKPEVNCILLAQGHRCGAQ